MTWGDVQLHMEADGTEYLEYFERQTKTRTGAEPRILRAVNEGFRSTKRSTWKRSSCRLEDLFRKATWRDE